MAAGGGRPMIAVLLVLGLLHSAAALTYYVGTPGSNGGWTLQPNDDSFYDDEFKNITLFVNDALYFSFSVGSHNVHEVTQENLKNCDGTSSISTYTTSSTIPLTSAGYHGFICTVPTHCSQYGMHLSVTVLSGSTPTAAPSLGGPPGPAPLPSPLAPPFRGSPGPAPISPIASTPVPSPTPLSSGPPLTSPSSSPTSTPVPSPTPLFSGPPLTAPSSSPTPSKAPSPTPLSSGPPLPAPSSSGTPSKAPSPNAGSGPSPAPSSPTTGSPVSSPSPPPSAPSPVVEAPTTPPSPGVASTIRSGLAMVVAAVLACCAAMFL